MTSIAEAVDPSVNDAAAIVAAEFPGYDVAISCSKHHDAPRMWWAITLSQMVPPKCERCQLPEKVNFAATHVAKSFAEALDDIRGQMWQKPTPTIEGNPF